MGRYDNAFRVLEYSPQYRAKQRRRLKAEQEAAQARSGPVSRRQLTQGERDQLDAAVRRKRARRSVQQRPGT